MGRKPIGNKPMGKPVAFRVSAGELRTVDELAQRLKTNRSTTLRRLVKKAVSLLSSSELENQSFIG